MAIPKIMWYLKQTDLFSDLNEHELQMLAQMVLERPLADGETMHLVGEPEDATFVIKSGKVKLSRVGEDGRKLTVDILEAGGLFGELAPGEGGPDDVVVEALENSYVCTLTRDSFESVLRMRPDLALRVVHMVDQRRRKAEMRLRDVLFYDVPTRLARILLELAEQHGTMTRDGVRLNLRLTHEELANLTGSARETISATLAGFRRRGLVQYRGREPMLLHPGLLAGQARLP